MADRDLRALDMRHTLPNLKNLLLTLTDGVGARLAYVTLFCKLCKLSETILVIDSSPPALNSPVPSASGLESPRAKSPPTLTLTPSSPHDTDHTRQSDAEIADGNTPPSSGATTPTHDRKTRSLLGLYPLTGFLRSRYPSIVGRPSVKSVAETSEGGLENGDAPTAASHSASDETSDDDEDRQTIRGVVMESEPVQEGKEPANINGQSVVNGEARPWQKEKFIDGAPPLASNA
jgi:UV radiation resistance-associated gene protein